MRWPWLIRVSRNFGIAMCAPVSPPVVVVFVSSMLGWSCDSVTTMTLAIVITVMAPGTHHQRPRSDTTGSEGGEPGPPTGPAGPAVRVGRLLGHGLGPGHFSHVRPGASQRGARCPSNRSRSATSGLRYRPALPPRARASPEFSHCTQQKPCWDVRDRKMIAA